MTQRIYFFAYLALTACVVASGCHFHWLAEEPYPYDDQIYGAILPSQAEIDSYPKAISPRAFDTPAAPSSSLTSAWPPDSAMLSNTPPIGQQGPCSACTSQGSPGSCISWSFAYGMGSYTVNLSQGWGVNDLSHLISPAFLYEYVLKLQSETCPTGTEGKLYLDYLVNNGAVTFSTAPYVADCANLNQVNLNDPPDPAFKIGSYTYIKPADRTLIKEHLASGYAVAFAGHLFDGFGDLVGPDVFYGSGPFEVNHTTGKLVAHGMLLIGYDDNRGDPSKGLGAYRIQNSFGTNWGDDGYLWMSYDTFENSILATFSAEPLSSPQPAVADLAPSQPSAPPARITHAVQWAKTETNSDTRVHLALRHQFDAPVQIRSIELTDPSGKRARHRVLAWQNNGYSHVSRIDGFQFLAGIYHVVIHARLADGTESDYVTDLNIGALPNSSLPSKQFDNGVVGTSGQPARIR